MTNTARAKLATQKLAFVIFGASGDLAMRMLIPSLETISCYDSFSEETRIIGVARTEFKGNDLETKLINGIKQFSRIGPDSDDAVSCEIPSHFLRRVTYISGDYDDPKLYKRLSDELAKTAYDGVLIYCATPPTLVQTITTGLKKAKIRKTDDRWVRLIVEKPFGYDLKTAIQLNDKLHENFTEEEIYRIDHYLAKETVMNIFTFRWGNTIWEPLWNRNYISHVEIIVAEAVDVGTRTGYYDGASVLRDMIQNHLMQMLAIIAMEPPSVLDAKAIRDEKMKVLHAIRALTPDDVILGQYFGYQDHKGIRPNSTTPTLAYIRFFIDNWRWQGVPFYVTSGKLLKKKKSVIKMVFNEVPHSIFGSSTYQRPNVLKIRVQPNEGIILSQHVKVPGIGLQTTMIPLSFNYESKFGKNALQGAYERVILDAIAGDQSFFTRADEIEQAWRIIEPLLSTDNFVIPYAPGMNICTGSYMRKHKTRSTTNKYVTPGELVNETTEMMTRLITEAIKTNGVCRIALSGGSSPRPVYSMFTSSPFASRVDMSKLHIFFVDERCVPPTDSQSNYKMIKEALIDMAKIPAANVHRMKGEIDPAEAAKQYTQELLDTFGSSEVAFDLIMLGMGPDAHTASLFPGTPAIDDHESYVIGHYVPQQKMNRITLGPRVLNSAKNVIFFIGDASKKNALHLVRHAPYCPQLLPAQVVSPPRGNVVWNVLIE